MPKKCHSCSHFIDSLHNDGYCTSPSVKIAIGQPNMTLAVPLNTARDRCDREGDGHFVYFEPRDPAAGSFVKITVRNEKATMKAAA